jgi:hypothetical protein
LKDAVPLKLNQSGGSEAVVAADLNGDGISDIATSLTLQDKVAVFAGQGKGSFAAAVYSALPTGSVPVGIVVGALCGGLLRNGLR